MSCPTKQSCGKMLKLDSTYASDESFMSISCLIEVSQAT